MLELGDKQDAGRVYKPWFESLGFRHVSVDINGMNGALPLDLTKPLDLGTFDMVSNIGTSEHVSENDWGGQVECWRNMFRSMHVGSVLICDTPKPVHWKGHGTWYPTKEFYKELAKLNCMKLERLEENDWRPNHTNRPVISARMVMTAQIPHFTMPPRVLMHHGA